MDRTTREWMIPEGAEVYGAEGDKIGKVVAANESYIVVEKGFFFPSDHDIPVSAIANFDGQNVYLAVSKDQALNGEWGTVSTDYVETGTMATDTTVGYNTASAEAYDTTGTYAGGDVTTTRSADYTTTDTDTLRVPVHEEELLATTRTREIGEVQVTKDVVAEERTLEVPVTEERVRVTRHATSGEAVSGEGAFEEGTIAVPLRGEEVELEKRTRVAEEVEIAKEQVQRTEQVGGTVRREQVRVEGDTTLDDTTERSS